jgi:hypothetical protein
VPPKAQEPIEMLSNREEIIEEINQKFKQELEVVLANEE